MRLATSSLGASVLAAALAAGLGAPSLASEPPVVAEATITEAAFAGLVEQAAAEAIKARVAPPDYFEVVACRMDGGSRPEAGSIRLEVLDAEGPNGSGVARVRLRVLAGDKPAGEARATVRGEVRGPVLVSRATLRRGVPVPLDAVEIAETVVTRLTDPPLRGTGEVRGQVPLRTIAAGQVLTASLLGGPTVVRRGQPVTLKIENSRFSVAASGTARRDGAVGDSVPAVNAATGSMVIGRVQPDGSLLVLRPVESRRRKS
jgi:flagellar basal body P-ring formation protein FlgA